MIRAHTRLTPQGKVSVPASVCRALGLAPGSMLEWVEARGRIVVKRGSRHSSIGVHAALFPDAAAAPVEPKSLSDLKQGIRRHMQRRHAGE